MRNLKNIAILIAVILLILIVCMEMKEVEHMYLGKKLYKIRNNEALELIKEWITLLVIKDDTSFCYLISEDCVRVSKSVRLNNQGEIIATARIKVLEITSDQAKIPDSLQELFGLYGQPHFDAGSGFFLPGYILADASILIFDTSGDKVTGYRLYQAEQFIAPF